METGAQVKVISEMAIEIARPDIIGVMEKAVPKYEVVPESTGYSLTMYNAGILWKPDGEKRLTSEWIFR